MNRKEIVSNLRTFFSCRAEIEVCLLFGSAAERDLVPANNDLDIAVCGEKAFDHELLADLQLELSEKFGRDVDLLDMNRLNGLILLKVITKGIKVVNNKPELLAFHIKRMLFYREDMYPNVQMMQKAKLKRFAHGH